MGKKKILIIEPIFESTISEMVNSLGFLPIVTRSHLQGLKLLDEENPEIILASSEETDINGLEFCKLVRFRERNGILGSKYIIVLLPEKEIPTISSQGCEADDIIVEPFREDELKWRINNASHKLKKVKKLENMLQLDPATGVLNKEGIKIFLKKEVSRAIRDKKELSVLVLKLVGLDKVKTNYGPDWIRWLEEVYVNHLKSKIRTFEGFGKWDEGVYCVITESPFSAMKGLAKRFKREHQHLMNHHESLKNLHSLDIEIGGINILLVEGISQSDKVVNLLLKFLETSIYEDQFQEDFIKIKISEDGITLI